VRLEQINRDCIFKFRLVNGDWSTGDYKIHSHYSNIYLVKNITPNGFVFELLGDVKVKSIVRGGCIRALLREQRDKK